MKRIAALALCTSGMYASITINDIQFEGLYRLSPTTATEMLGFAKGSSLNIDKVNASISAFYAQGYFNDVWVEEQNGTIIYHFSEKPAIAKVDFTGYGESEKEKFVDVVGVKKGDIFDEAKIEAAKKRIIKKVEADGYVDTVVEVEQTKTSEGALELNFVINKGEHIIIQKLNIFGNKNFKSQKLLSNAANKEKQFLGWLWGRDDGKLRISELEYDSARIRDVYMQNGYLDAKVSNPLLSADFNSYTALLDYTVEEGKAYTVTDVKVELSDPVIAISELMPEVKLSKGKVFNVEKLRKDLESLRIKIGDKGYAYARVNPDIQKNEANGTAVVVYKIEAGKKVYINDVFITGNNRTLDSVVRREIYLAHGDLYSTTDMTESKNALRRTGFFDDVNVEERRVSEDKIDLIVTVKEAMTGNLLVGGGYGSYDKLLLNASVSDKNFLGSGLTLGLSLDYSSKRSVFDINVYNPRFRDSEYSLNFDIYNSKYEAYDYTENKKGLSVGIGKKLTRHAFANMSYNYVDRSYTYVDLNTSTLYDLAASRKSSIIPSLSYDNTDDYYVPRKGIAAGMSLEYAGVGGDEKFIKNYNRFTYFYGLEDKFDIDLILRYKARMGYIFDKGYLSRAEKFYLGGVGSIRGFQSSSISPKNSDGTILMGGKKMFSQSFEANIPLIDAAKMRLTAFYDWGCIGDETFSEIKRSGRGIAIEWYSPLGPIQLIFARPVKSEPGDHTSSFEFTIGSRF